MMSEFIQLKKSNCKNCYKCIRHCAVKSIAFTDDRAHIIDDECILCGHCYVVCPQDAKQIRNDVQKAKELIAKYPKVIASIAPSFVANYKGVSMPAMQKALQQLGFFAADETAVGATYVKTQYEKLVAGGDGSPIISSCCHTVNLLIRKHYPDALPYLAKVVSPMAADCLAVKQQYPDAKTVFIGPCISKKAEAEQYPEWVDCVLTFEELTGWMQEQGVEFEQIPEDITKTKARLFPTTGGILKTMQCDAPNYTYMSIDGIDNCVQVLQDIARGTIKNCFIEMSACVGSCIGGPVMEKYRNTPVADFIAVEHAAGPEQFEITPLDEQMLVYEQPYIGVHKQMPGKLEIEAVLKKMGKEKPEDELNCGTCGYNTCREKAIAVCQGKANISMCLPFLKEKAESFSDNIIKNTPNGIIVLNEALEVQQINRAAMKILNVRSASDVLGEQVVRVLEPKDFFEVLESGHNIHDKRMYLAEYKKYVEETVIYDKNYRILMCILRDVTDEEAERESKEKLSRQTIEITDKVVEKQMRVVQEIASLLGETTAETKIALTKLKESLSDE